ncbi:glycine zipper 2TM domain-containing protein [Undibacterium rugosum]|uniref:glycine zipper 2TM domain-containing protein n=1 Tax=Undibacterium rugosum TaxID=2762291 RepID=UPI001B82D995|nr:glycine zipper 2TM domain-containing protein [Undibacterium rugosum]MBR7779273.1 glycine zipper 2TM domain-containing protein [Undibacterium rugosum]
MKKNLMLAGLLLSSASAVFAQNAQTSKQQYSEASKQAANRYAEDKKLCAEEASSSARMQCLRDAKSVYTNALAAAKTASVSNNVSTNQKNQPVCAECGRVVAVNVSEKEGEGSALGVIAGGVAGALLGNQVGGGTGRDLATIAGAAGGAMAGHKIEQKVKSAKVWTITVQYDNGNKQSFHFDQDPGFQSGDLVKNSGSGIVRR